MFMNLNTTLLIDTEERSTCKLSKCTNKNFDRKHEVAYCIMTSLFIIILAMHMKTMFFFTASLMKSVVVTSESESDWTYR